MAHLALRSYDLSTSGAVATADMRTALRARPNGIILGGGEIIGATWGSAAASMIPAPFDLPLLAVRKWISPGVFDAIGRWALGGSSPTPYVPDVGKLDGVRLVANAIGASSIDQLRPAIQAEVIRALSTAKFLSVRDSTGQSLLEDHGVKAVLAPDCVSPAGGPAAFRGDRKSARAACGSGVPCLAARQHAGTGSIHCAPRPELHQRSAIADWARRCSC